MSDWNIELWIYTLKRVEAKRTYIVVAPIVTVWAGL